MITRIEGEFVEKTVLTVVIRAGGLHYEVFVSPLTLQPFLGIKPKDPVSLEIYHYLQTDPSRSIPVLIGFGTRFEREFFEKFITVSGIGPRAALRALAVPIPQIAAAIDDNDRIFLKTLPGVGEQRAREIIAKLSGKVGKFCLIKEAAGGITAEGLVSDVREEAIQILIQLQYRKEEAKAMVDAAYKKNGSVESAEELLNEVYKQRGQKTHSSAKA